MPVSSQNDTLNASTLDQFPPSYLSLEGPHNPQPWLDPRSRFLYGPAGQPSGMNRGEDGRGRVEEDIYGFWVDRGRGIVVSGLAFPSSSAHAGSSTGNCELRSSCDRICGTGPSTRSTLANPSAGSVSLGTTSVTGNTSEFAQSTRSRSLSIFILTKVDPSPPELCVGATWKR
jgi:hypothetical protein